MKVLLVGGSGLVGTFITPYLAEHHELRVFDLVEPGHAKKVEYIQGSISEPGLGIPAAPELHGHDRDPDLAGDVLDGDTIGRAEHDARTGHEPLFARGRSHERLQDGLVDWSDGQGRCRSLSHVEGCTRSTCMPLSTSGPRH